MLEIRWDRMKLHTCACISMGYFSVTIFSLLLFRRPSAVGVSLHAMHWCWTRPVLHLVRIYNYLVVRNDLVL